MKTLTIEDEPKRAFRVLVAEDDVFIGLFYEDALAEMGHKVCALETTESGVVAAAIRLKPDLLIVDVSLRDGNGVDAVREVLRNEFVPHVFVSGNTAGIESLMPGAIVVQKPFLPHELARAIQRALHAVPTRTSGQ